MKNILKYMLMAGVVALTSACQKEMDNAILTDENGGVVFNISMSDKTRADESARPDELRMRVYDVANEAAPRLIRTYQKWEDVPETLYLIEGKYSVAVQAGDKYHKAFKYSDLGQNDVLLKELYYIGEKAFSVKKGLTEPVAVECKAENVKLDVLFQNEDGENSRISEAAISVATSTETLSMNGSDTCYFLLPENEQGEVESTLAWTFSGVHTAKDGTVTNIDKAGNINVEKGKAYQLKFVFSKTPDGRVTLTLMVEQQVEWYDDTMSFKPQPEFQMTGMSNEGGEQTYIAGNNVEFDCQSINPIANISVRIGTGAYEEIWSKSGAASDNFEFVVEDNAKSVTVIAKPSFFAEMAGGEQNFTLKAVDVNGGAGDYKTTFVNQGLDITKTTADLWLNTAQFCAIITDAATPSMKVQFRRKGSDEWAVTEAGKYASGLIYTANSVASWIDDKNGNDFTIYKPDHNKSIYANGTYECQLVLNGEAYGPIVEYTAKAGQTIPYATLDDSSLSCWGQSNSNAPFWGSGNNSYKPDLCVQATHSGMQGSYCAKMASSETLSMLAAGNIFTGTFSMSGFSGTVAFGVDYAWEARPTAMKVKVWHNIGNVTTTKYSSAIPSGSPDQASIYCCIIDWDSQHKVTSGASDPSGVWSPENGADAVSAGKIIGYGVIYPQGKTEGDSMVEMTVPIQYYDKVTKPSKKYKLIIAASTSRYGDYMNGCKTNEMYIDDFQWVY
ncbi:MAG: PCMD domain-containing protein [Alistipes sp.]|nr:PCMD domain-containing protein [Alistipes sp.]